MCLWATVKYFNTGTYEDIFIKQEDEILLNLVYNKYLGTLCRFLFVVLCWTLLDNGADFTSQMKNILKLLIFPGLILSVNKIETRK